MTDPARSASAPAASASSVLKPDFAATTVPRRTWIALAILLAGVAMAMIDNSIVNVALPTIRTSLDAATGGASEATLSWIISGYALAFGLALIPAGRIGDRIGHKWVFLVGLAGFTIASLACGLSDNSTQLIVARVAQGLFGGIFFPAVTALIQLMFPPRVRGKAFAVLGVVIGVATAAGPLVGGLLIQALGDQDGWRSIFFVNIPIGVIAVVAALFFVPSGAEAHGKSGLDLIGVILLAASLVAILVPLIQGQDAGWPLWTYLSLAGGAVLLVLFALWERGVAGRGSFPIVPPRLFAHASFTGGTILALVFFAAFTSIFFTISILWQAGLGHTSLESGLVTMPFALGILVGATLGARLIDRLGRTVLSLGSGLVALGLIGTWLVVAFTPAADLTNWELLAPLALGGIGSGFFIAPNAQFIVATVDRTEAGAASGVVGTAQRVGSAIGIAVIGSVLFGTLDITSSVAGPPTVGDIATGFTHAATFALGTSAAFAVLAFLLVFALPKRVPQWGAPVASAD